MNHSIRNGLVMVGLVLGAMVVVGVVTRLPVEKGKRVTAGLVKVEPKAVPTEVRVDAPVVERPVEEVPVVRVVPKVEKAPVVVKSKQGGVVGNVAPVELKLPVARAALALAGADPDAEAVWAAAINDPGMSAHDRSDLIEDLNETGFADPEHVTAEDLPLIVSRLQLIEEMAPDAMDQTNLDAFAEAYKDLVNMYVKVTEQ